MQPGGPNAPVAAQLTVSSSASSIPTDGSQTRDHHGVCARREQHPDRERARHFFGLIGRHQRRIGTTGTDGTATATLGTAGDSSASHQSRSRRPAARFPATVTVQGHCRVERLRSPWPWAVALAPISRPACSVSATRKPFSRRQHDDTGGPAAVGRLAVHAIAPQSISVRRAQPRGLATITQSGYHHLGIASVTYVATRCSGADVITASVDGRWLGAIGNWHRHGRGRASSVRSSSCPPTPTNVALRGTGSSGHPETSTVIFRVLDQAGGPRVGTTVNFALNTTVGGISVSPATAQSDAKGNVQTVVQGGTVATPVRVTATVQGVTPVCRRSRASSRSPPVFPTRTASRSPCSVRTSKAGIAMASSCRSPRACRIVSTTLFRRARPLPFRPRVDRSCPSARLDAPVGACSVNWTSSNPRPPARRLLLLIQVISAPVAQRFWRLPSAKSRSPTRTATARSTTARTSRTCPNGSSTKTRTAFATIVRADLRLQQQFGVRPADGDFNGVLCLDTTGRCSANATTGISVDQPDHHVGQHAEHFSALFDRPQAHRCR